MLPLRGRLFLCALTVGSAVLPLRAAEVVATPVGCCHRKCYNPCEPVGPVRRFLRRVFLRPCPPVAPVIQVAPAPVFMAPAPPACAPPGPPAVDLGRPTPPPPPVPPVPVAPPSPPTPFPGVGSAYRHTPEVLTPPAPPPPIRVDRIASRAGAEVQVMSRRKAPAPPMQVTLIHARQTQLRQVVAADGAGRFDVKLAPGEWLVYTRGADGQDVYQGRIEVRDTLTTSVRVPVK